MIRTDTNTRTGVNTNYRTDFGWRTYAHLLNRLVTIRNSKKRAMWKALHG
jgi:hypothetical protein